MSFFIFTTAYNKFKLYYVKEEHAKFNHQLAFLDKYVQNCQKKYRGTTEYEKTLRLKYGMKVIPDDVRLAGVGEILSSEDQLFPLYTPSMKKVLDLGENISTLLRQINLEDSLLDEVADYIATRNKQWEQFPSIRPTTGRLASRFGWRTDPMGGEETCFHEGLDISNKVGTPIYATGDGIVQFVGAKGTLGNAVCIAHTVTGYETVYAHLKKYVVKENHKIHRGELIGYMGNTGRSTGPHLHYEVRKSGKALNPEEFILPESVMVD